MSVPSEAAGLLEHLVFEIAEGVSAQTGGAFFHSLVRRLAAVLQADFVLVGTFLPDGKRIATLAAYGGGADAPTCEYDKDLLLAQMGAEGYVDSPLIDSGGRRLGVLCALTRQPLQNPKLAEAVVRIFAVRAASELERRELTELAPLLPTLSLHDAERRHVEGVLASTRWVVEGPKGAAGILQMNPSTLRSLMKRLGIRRPA